MTGLLAAFSTEERLRGALARLADAHIRGWETYTPKPLDEHPSGSPLPLVMFVAGMLGFIGFFALMTYADVWDYPIDIGGRPNFAWPSFVPIAFELAALCAMGAGFLGFFIACRLPRLYAPIDECDDFRAAMRDGWFVAIRAKDAAELARARAVLADTHPSAVQDFAA